MGSRVFIVVINNENVERNLFLHVEMSREEEENMWGEQWVGDRFAVRR